MVSGHRDRRGGYRKPRGNRDSSTTRLRITGRLAGIGKNSSTSHRCTSTPFGHIESRGCSSLRLSFLRRTAFAYPHSRTAASARQASSASDMPDEPLVVKAPFRSRPKHLRGRHVRCVNRVLLRPCPGLDGPRAIARFQTICYNPAP
jgi:hypothetical protein